MGALNLTPDMLAQARSASSAEELMTFAQANGVTLNEHDAATAFAALHAEGTLADEELVSISGGCSIDLSKIVESSTNAASVGA